MRTTHPTWVWLSILIFALALSVGGCTRGDFPDEDAEHDEDFENPGGEGVEVLWQPNADPVALIPQPNNILTKKDETTPTGLRVNLPVDAQSDFARTLRTRINQLDGFGNFNNIAVSFSDRLDLRTISDETIYLVDVQPDSKFYGEVVALDLGKGFFPKDLLDPEAFYPNDPMAKAKDLLYKPGNRVDWYEDETNTLLIRPILPLHQQSKYVVVLTTGLRGEDGLPVRPPDYFEYVTFPEQIESLEDASDVLKAEKGLDPDDIAFAWEFTTATVTEPLESLRRGLYGEGPFDWIHDELDTYFTEIHDFGVDGETDGNPKTFEAARFAELINFIATFVPDASNVPLDLIVATDSVAYFVSGSYTTLSFLETKDRVFHMDIHTGEAEYQPEEVPFFIAIPEPNEKNNFAQPPYPVAFFQHANIRSRLDFIAIASANAEQGIATFAIDAAEHGPESIISGVVYVLEGLQGADLGWLSDVPVELIIRLLMGIFYPSIDISDATPAELVQILKEKTFIGALLHGRTPDLDGDGFRNSGQTFYSADIFRTNAISRQTQFDLFQAVRVINGLGEDWNGNGKLDIVEGDFNQDGIVDLGGAANPLYFVGMSLGSIMGIPFVSMEPEIDAAVFNVPGGGLSDILMRTNIPNVNDGIRADLTGPVVVGRPVNDENHVALTINKQTLDKRFATIRAPEGTTVVLENLDSGQVRETRVGENGAFSVTAASDAGDRFRLRVVDREHDEIIEEVEWNSKLRGEGVLRNTPEARAFVDNAQWAVSQVDPITFAPFLMLDPRPYNNVKNFLIQICSPDTAVPTAPGVAVIRAAGLMDDAHADNFLERGALDWERISYSNANQPIESFAHQAWRLHPGSNHEYMLAPRFDPYSIMYSVHSKRQAALFLKTGGEEIVDNVRITVPPEYLADPIDPDYYVKSGEVQ
ncbi:MAG: hypothetical protein H6684_14415 [Deltaproteobacteria bacterium]|nr:hypothetical protein [Deltaproteobacteria bacterium]MCB9489923.1 hypothetical protein [Deltaproteobacteria bacterium]